MSALRLPASILAAGSLAMCGGYYTWQVLSGNPVNLRFWETPVPDLPMDDFPPLEYQEAPMGTYDRLIIFAGIVGGAVFLWWRYGPRQKLKPKPSPPNVDYYGVLGLKQGCSADEIKRAYRKLALVHHPDKNRGDPAAEARFKSMTEAYRVLSNPEKRSLYDSCILWKRVNLPDGEG